MSYAVRNDGQGWRAVNGPEDVGPDETHSETQPVLALQPAERTRFSSLEFLERFTEQEQLTVVTATMQNPQVKLWYDKLLAAEYVDINDPRTEGGIDALISAGLIQASRKSTLLQSVLV